MPPSDGTRNRLIHALGFGRGRRDNLAADAAARLIDDFRDPACVLDHEGVPLAVNDAGVTYAACLTPGQPGPFTDLLGRAIECGGVVSGEIPCPGGDGVLSLDVTILPVLGDGAWLALFTDRTLDNNLRAALAESRQRYKDLVEISSDFGWETGPDGTFVFISPGGALGHDASRLIGRRPEEFVRNPEDYAPLPFVCHQRVEGVEVWMRGVDGGEACLLVSAMPLRATDGRYLGARGLCRDISREREQEAEQSRARHSRRGGATRHVVRGGHGHDAGHGRGRMPNLSPH